MSGDTITPVQSPGSDISPQSQPTPHQSYFDKAKRAGLHDDGSSQASSKHDVSRKPSDMGLDGERKEMDTMSDASATTPGDTAPSPSSTAPPSRKTSISSVTFRKPRTTLPQGLKKPHGGSRIREASPPHRRFERHVAFDNVPLGEPTDYNPISFTLNVRHKGYQLNRHSRTFMVGVDDNSYSDHALQWLLSELVDDGDEIVCVRVIEAPTRLAEKAYQESANSLMNKIYAKNTKNLAISFVLEYAVGKLHNTFQHMIKIHQPSMLIVGTKGRSLDGVQGFLANRNSFSKYCLQYSPVPVVVVRPTEKREKKKFKRQQDPNRNSYLTILGGQKHEADSENSSIYELEPTLGADEEAHRVAMAVGLPAAYDPTIKPIDPSALLNRGGARRAAPATPEAVALAATGRVPADPVPEKKAASPDSEGDDSDYEEEFEVSTGEEALKRLRLHRMESNEGAALKEMRKMSTESIEEEDEDENGGAKTGNG